MNSGSRSQSVVLVLALGCALLVTTLVDEGIVVSALLGAGVGGGVAWLGMFVTGALARRGDD